MSITRTLAHPMNIQQSSRRIAEIGIIPVIRAANSVEARQAVQAIYAGGISIVEITMTIPDCPSVIRDVVREYGDKILVGAGTVLNHEPSHPMSRCRSRIPNKPRPLLASSQSRSSPK